MKYPYFEKHFGSLLYKSTGINYKFKINRISKIYKVKNKKNQYNSNESVMALKSICIQNKHENNKLQDFLGECDNIKIIDAQYNSCDLFLDKNRNIRNDQMKVVGKIKDWIDEKGDIPIEFKNKDNIVIHPKTIIPLMELELFPVAGLYCNIQPGTYREYEYNEFLESFSKTNQVII
tara:strand:+ start:103 stop:633 length:531 start_codon:yes stop_codon:yes gene_type:complete